MTLHKYRWSKTFEAEERELLELGSFKAVESERWHADPYEEFDEHSHPKDKKLWCVEGSIVFTINAQEIVLQAGDGLNLPANTRHSALAGLTGCICYESPPIADNPTV